MEVLRDVGGSERESLLTDYMECASAIGDLELVRDFHGELRGSGAIQLPQFRDWLAQRAAWCLQRSDMPEAEAIDPVALTEAWPEPAAPALVHFDVFPGNLLADAGRITSVLDFGTLTISGDRRLDPLNAAVYLEPAFSPSARASDRALAHQWLETKGLGPLYALTRRWLAVFWSAAVGEKRLRSWSRDVLREPWPPTAPDAS